MPSLAPAKAICKSIYQPAVIILGNTATSTIQWYYFKGNDLFDPDYTGAGANSSGVSGGSSFAAFYDKYFVRKSACSVKVQMDLDAGPGPTYIFLCPVFDDDSTTNTPPAMPTMSTMSLNNILTTLGSYPFMKWARLYGSATAQNAGKNFRTLKFKPMSTRYMVGKKYDELTLFGTTGGTALLGGSSPIVNWFWAFGVYNPSTTNSISHLQLMPKLTYWAEFFDRYPPVTTQFG